MRRIFSLVVIFIIGGIGGIFLDHWGVPYLASTQLGSRIPELRRISERTTIINKTEVVRIEETGAIPDLAERVKNAALPIEVEATQHARPKRLPESVLTTGLALTSDGFILLHAESSAPKAALVGEDGGRIPLTLVASSTATGFTILKAPERQFVVLPFANGIPRLGSRLFALSSSYLGKEIASTFQSATLSSFAKGLFTVSNPMAKNAIIVNFSGELIGMNVEEGAQSRIVPAAELQHIADTLLKK